MLMQKPPTSPPPAGGGAHSASGSSTSTFLTVAGGVFAFYVVHDAIQERLFRIDGFEFGSFMTVAELGVMSFGSLLSRLTTTTAARATRSGGDLLPPLSVMVLYAALVVLLVLSQTSGSQVGVPHRGSGG
jgi:hypothetical protein